MSTSVDRGVSTTSCVDAAAISSEREVSRGGNNPTPSTLQTAAKNANAQHPATHPRICQSPRMRMPKPTVLVP